MPGSSQLSTSVKNVHSYLLYSLRQLRAGLYSNILTHDPNIDRSPSESANYQASGAQPEYLAVLRTLGTCDTPGLCRENKQEI